MYTVVSVDKAETVYTVVSADEAETVYTVVSVDEADSVHCSICGRGGDSVHCSISGRGETRADREMGKTPRGAEGGVVKERHEKTYTSSLPVVLPLSA